MDNHEEVSGLGESDIPDPSAKELEAKQDEVPGSNWFTYNRNVEIFIALWDVDFYYSAKGSRFNRTVSTKHIALTVVGYWKPPGALQWVEKCVTETVFKEKSPSFAMKMHLQCNEIDTGSIKIKFEVRDMSYEYANTKKVCNTLGTVETTLQLILESQSKGLILPIPFSNKSPLIQNDLADLSQSNPGQIFLRGELLKEDLGDDAVLLQFGLRRKPGARSCRRFYIELSKINEDTIFELPQPYTLIHRSELADVDGEDHLWHHIITPFSRICNGNMERVLKLSLFDADKPAGVPSGFSLFTLRKLLDDNELALPINQASDGKVSQKVCLYVNKCSKLSLHPLEYYFERGLTLHRIFAVDYSTSNWNIDLHRKSLHDGIFEGPSSYEEAIKLTAESVKFICSGDSVFYSFGNARTLPFVATFDESGYMEAVMNNYKAALMAAKMSSLDIDNEKNCNQQCIPIHAAACSRTRKTTVLGTLLNDLLELLSVKREIYFEYYVAFIFTDGEICDLDQCMHTIIELAKLPISLIFVGIGLGDLSPLMKLQEDWTHPITRRYPCRRLTYLIHFRSLLDWDSSIKFAHFKSDPIDLFKTEIHCTLQKQIVKYMRTMLPSV